MLASAIRHHQSGQLQMAERLYRQILEEEPRHADALHLLGVIALQMGQHDSAIDLIRRAIAIDANAAPFHCNLGAAYQAIQRLEDAAPCFQRATELNAEFSQAHSNLGSVLVRLGRVDEAVTALERALELNPGDVEARLNLGVAFKERGRSKDAVATYQQVIKLKPDYAEAYSNLGNAQKSCGDLPAAIDAFQHAIRLKPEYPEAHLGLGASLNGCGQLPEAIACYERVIELKPNYAEAYGNLGNALREQGRLGEAITSLQKAVELKPAELETQLNLGMALKQHGRFTEAETVYRQILQQDPDYPEVHGNLGLVLQEQGRFDDAIECYRRALELKPDFHEARAQLVYQQLHICEWADVVESASRVVEVALQADSRISPFLVLNLGSSSEEQFVAARQWATSIQRSSQSGRFKHGPHDKSRLTLGYLSADFRDHPVANLAAELFEQHDRSRFAVHGYSFGPDDGSSIRGRLVNAFDTFRDVSTLSHQQTAECIHADGVDILIDMMGYTRLARTQVLAMRPAPIQVNYLGYPGTMGAEFIDYIVVDDFVVPADRQEHFSERLVHLPGSYLVNDSRRVVETKTPSRHEFDLPAEGFVFCCFNQSRKIWPQVYDVWMRLLTQVPNSVLWLPEPNRFAVSNLERETGARGVDPVRVIFAPKVPSMEEHLLRIGCADLFLDTWPYNAHATASDALSVGCPVLTYAGDSFVGRVAGSLLRAIGMSELITESPEEYADLAVALARDGARLAAVRDKLRVQRDSSGFLDGAQFARNLELAIEQMWTIYCRGGPPQPIRVERSP
jgi:protein O-GlcNAc transferase